MLIKLPSQSVCHYSNRASMQSSKQNNLHSMSYSSFFLLQHILHLEY